MPNAISKPDSEHVAYVTGLFPAVSHTFLLREVIGLRAAGVQVETFSLNRPGSEHLIGPEERAAAASTCYLLSRARNPAVLLSALAHAIMRPRQLVTALSLFRKSGSTGIKGHAKQLIYLLEAMVLSRILRRRRVSRIHNQLGMASASVSMYASILAEIPFSFTLHGPDDFFDENTRQMPIKIATADFVACISEYCRTRAEKLCTRQDSEKLHIVRCGINPAAYSRLTKKPPLRRILFVGRLVPVKGVAVLLQAFRRLVDLCPDASLTIVGQGGERTKLESLAVDLGLKSRIVFTGALTQQEVSAQMSEADVFVLPSFDEGLPVAIMEAMAAGVPVIATAVGGTPELVEDRITGQLVEAGDVEQLTQAMAACLIDPLPALEMTRCGKARVFRDHDMWAEARRLASLFCTGCLERDDGGLQKVGSLSAAAPNRILDRTDPE